MDTEVRELLHNAAPEPSAPLDAGRLWARGRRQRRKRRGLTVLAAVVLVAAAILGLGAVTSRPVQPEIVGQPNGAVPSGWQTLRVGKAAFAVPGDWPVQRIDGLDDPMPCLDRLAVGAHRVYLADRLYLPPCVAAAGPSPAGQVAVYAYPAATMSPVDRQALIDEGRRVELSGTVAWMDEAGTYHTYLFDEADAVLLITRRWDPALADRILATVRPIGRTTQPTPAESASDASATVDCSGQATPRYSDVPDGWTALPAAPEPRTGPATVWTGEKLLAFGGQSAFGATLNRSLFAFDPVTATWSCPSSVAFEVVSPNAAWNGELAFVWGPRRAAAYDPANGTWHELPLPSDAPYYPFTVTWAGDELIVWGSDRRGAPTSRGISFDPATDSWRQLPEAPIAINQGQAIWTGTELIVYGSQLSYGNRATTSTAVGAAYNPQTNTWRTLPSFALSPQATSIAWTGQHMVAWDYELAAGIYDPQTDSWTALPNLPLGFSECYPDSATLSDGSVFAWYCGQAALLQSNTWTEIPTPVGRSTTTAGAVDQISGNPNSTGTDIYLVGAAHEGQDDALWKWTPTD